MDLIILKGAQIEPYLTEIVDLMLTVYRESPFFYEGTREEYLPLVKAYSDSPQGLVCLLIDGDQIVGVAAGAPLKGVHEKWHAPFKNENLDPIFYLGDEVLLESYRGKHLGAKIFDAFMAQVPCSFSTVAFTVMEEPNEPEMKDALIKRGFTEHTDKAVVIPWTEIGAKEEVAHKLVYWMKELI